MGFFSRVFLVFLMKESKKKRPKQPGKSMAKSRSQPVNLPGVEPLMKPLHTEGCHIDKIKGKGSSSLHRVTKCVTKGCFSLPRRSFLSWRFLHDLCMYIFIN